MPVGIVVIAGERAAVILGRGESWLTTHAAELRVWLSLGFGAALIVDGALRISADGRAARGTRRPFAARVGGSRGADPAGLELVARRRREQRAGKDGAQSPR